MRSEEGGSEEDGERTRKYEDFLRNGLKW
jgi:hypothetical protein